MKSLWPENFEREAQVSAKHMISTQAKILQKITEGVVDAKVSDVDPMLASRLGISRPGQFIFKFEIIGRYIDNYRYLVFYFWHDINLYPVRFKLERELAAELEVAPTGSSYEVSVQSEPELEQFLGSVLKSSRIRTVVGAVVSLSR